VSFRIKNWDTFQHYKSGRGAPPWIKLYRGLLNDKEWFSLDASAAKFLVSLWILCAESDGIVPDSETIAFRLRLASKDVEKYLSLCSHWVIDDASTLLASGYQVATPETETETETDTQAKAAVFCFKTELLNLGVNAELADDWMKVRKAKKATNTKTAFSSFLREVEKAGWNVADAVSHCAEKDWKGFTAEWVKDVKPAEPAKPTLSPEESEAIAKAQRAIARDAYRLQQQREAA